MADVGADSGASESTGDTFTMPTPEEETGEPGTSTGAEPMPDSGGSFITMMDDDGPPLPECDVWSQDCPSGEKCTAYINDGGSAWNSTTCVDVLDPARSPGEACTAVQVASGEDDCETGSMCWNVNEEGVGYCVSLCTGSAANPICDDPDTSCVIVNDGVINLCLPDCHPLLQDCEADGESCYPQPGGFTCAPDVSGGAGAGEPCSGLNTCAGGTLCVAADLLPACDGPDCCTEFCETDLEDMCIDGAVCSSLYNEGEAPPGFETVGACLLP